MLSTNIWVGHFAPFCPKFFNLIHATDLAIETGVSQRLGIFHSGKWKDVDSLVPFLKHIS